MIEVLQLKNKTKLFYTTYIDPPGRNNLSDQNSYQNSRIKHALCNITVRHLMKV